MYTHLWTGVYRHVKICLYMYVCIFFNKFYTSKGEGFFSLVLFPSTLYSEYSKVPGT